MKNTIIYDNTAFRKELQADWGFSALVEIRNTPKILFDTSCVFGILAFKVFPLPAGPLIILFASFIFLISLIFKKK